MTRCAVTRHSIRHDLHCGVSPLPSPPCRHASDQQLQRLSPLSPLSPPPALGPVDIGQLIHQLREEGAMLRHKQNALIIRPTHWQQVNKISAHWKAVLRFLQDTENGEADGIGRPA